MADQFIPLPQEISRREDILRKCDGCGDPDAPFTLYYCEPCVTPNEYDARIKVDREERWQQGERCCAEHLRLRTATTDRDGIAQIIDKYLAISDMGFPPKYQYELADELITWFTKQ